MRIKHPKDFYSGILFVLFGGAFTGGATNYSMGTAARMGPAYFPFVLGVLLTVLGAILTTRSLVKESDEGRVGRLALKPAVLMFGSIGAFALLLRPAGLAVSVFAIIVISSSASQESRFKETLVSALLLCAASLAVFVYGLNLPIPVWPAFISR